MFNRMFILKARYKTVLKIVLISLLTLSEHALPPVKPPRKKDNKDSSKSKSVEKSSKSDSNEQFVDALSADEPTPHSTKTSFETAKEGSVNKNGKAKSEVDNLMLKDDSTTKTVGKNSQSVETKAVTKSKTSNSRDDDSLIEFERNKLTTENVDGKTAKISMAKRKQKGSESSEKEDDSLIEYEKRKSIPSCSDTNGKMSISEDFGSLQRTEGNFNFNDITYTGRLNYINIENIYCNLLWVKD